MAADGDFTELLSRLRDGWTIVDTVTGPLGRRFWRLQHAERDVFELAPIPDGWVVA